MNISWFLKDILLYRSIKKSFITDPISQISKEFSAKVFFENENNEKKF